MNANGFQVLANLAELIADIPADAIVSRTFHEDPHMKAILFGFAPGQELSEHTASQPAVLHFLEGQAHVTLGTESLEAEPGTWAHMSAGLPHSIKAVTRCLMLLLLFKGS